MLTHQVSDWDTHWPAAQAYAHAQLPVDQIDWSALSLDGDPSLAGIGKTILRLTAFGLCRAAVIDGR